MSHGTYVTIRYTYIPILFLYVPDFLIRGLIAKRLLTHSHEARLVTKNENHLFMLRELPRGYLASIQVSHWRFRLGRF